MSNITLCDDIITIAQAIPNDDPTQAQLDALRADASALATEAVTGNLTPDQLAQAYAHVLDQLARAGSFNAVRSSKALGSDSVALGEVTASGDNGFARGLGTVAEAPQSEAGGAVSHTRGIRGNNVRSNNVYNGDKVGNGSGTAGSANNEEFSLICVTTDATPGVLTTDGNDPGWWNTIHLSTLKPPGQTDMMVIVGHLQISAIDTANGDCRGWTVEVMSRSKGYHQVEVFSAVIKDVPGPTGGEAWRLDFSSVDPQWEAPLFKVIGEAGKVIQWKCAYHGIVNAVVR